MIAFGTKTQTRIRRDQSSSAAAEKNNFGANKNVAMNFSLDKKLLVEINRWWWI
jgi:hypothetical protein